MTKWNEPLGPVPSWLDPAMEVHSASEPPKLKKPEFVVACVNALLHMGLTIEEALEAAANTIVETGWGHYYMAFNLGGWKVGKDSAEGYEKKYGRKPKWWRAPGNKAPGATLDDYKGADPPWCFYRAFDSMEAYFTEWLRKFVPKLGTATPAHRYYKTGIAFWSRDGDWFRELCLAGYKSENARKNPDSTVSELRNCTREVGEFWAQSRLGVTVDGDWGAKSQAACRTFQVLHGLPETGALDHATLAALVG